MAASFSIALRGRLSLGCLCLSFLIGVHAVHAGAFVDTDGDGIPDALEQEVYQTDPMNADTDHDGFPDRVEILSGHNPHGTGLLTDKDTDQDGLVDRLELAFGTNPLIADTNGNGKSDFDDIYAGYSPTSTTPIVLQKSIYIRLANQRLEQRVMDIPISSFPVSSGMPGKATPVGKFKVLSKNPRAWSNSAKLWMPYWMHFSGRGHGIHELPEWPNGHKEGQAHLGRPVSHGCVRLGIGTAKKVYLWSPIGTPVIVVKR